LGGAIQTDVSATIKDSTFSDNSADLAGGAINIDGGTMTMDDCILWADSAGIADDEISGSATVTYSDVDGGWTGSGNINVDPNFVNAAGGDYRLDCPSMCINTGDTTTANIPDDTEDANEDNVTNKKIDLDLLPRIVGSLTAARVDMGAYEHQSINSACPGEADGLLEAQGVDIDDLLYVINHWGSCPGGGPPTGCPGDIAPSPCGDGTVNIDDLLAVLNNWGCGATTTPESVPSSLLDCIDACWGADNFGNCVDKCWEAVQSR